jgi:hypothetical protein
MVCASAIFSLAAGPTRQSMHMTSEARALTWPLTSAGSSIQLVWRSLGPVAWSGFAASFPATPKEPGVYLIKVTLDDRYRIYIGEAADLNRRLRSYGGRADEKPNQRGMTTTNMRGRIRRTCRAGGSAVAYLLELPIKHLPQREELDPRRKDCRITLERLALSAAYLRGEPLIKRTRVPRIPSRRSAPVDREACA